MTSLTALLAAALLATPALASPCKESKPGLKAQAKVSCATATKTALAKVLNAKVKSSELEVEKGKLVYSFDLAVKGKDGIDEVQVDALTGEVLSVEHEDAKAEAAEKAAERQEKAGK